MISIVEYTPDYIQKVKDFNSRLIQGGIRYQFPESNIPKWLPVVDGLEIYQKFYLAVDENDIVRGAYILKHQEFYCKGEKFTAGCLQLPLSEGLINKEFSQVGIRIILDGLERSPRCFALGIGSYEEAYSQVLLKLKWKHSEVPFYFKIIKPSQFFKNVTFLRRKKYFSTLLDIARFSILPGAGIRFLHWMKTSKPDTDQLEYQVITNFESWSDEIWESSKNQYSMIADRSSEILNFLYSRENNRFIKLKISKNGATVGWMVLLNTKVNEHRQFGNMSVGSIVDNLTKPGFEREALYCAEKYLRKNGADIIVSNQSAKVWCRGIESSGFIKGPSNYIFFASRELDKTLSPFNENTEKLFFNRGDGDGPINL